jgi:transcriptional regulator GlxA family with amidase domain
MPLDEVARASGFTDPDWFGKTFRERFDESPMRFRERNGGGNAE